jgi:hypothetical protein
MTVNELMLVGDGKSVFCQWVMDGTLYSAVWSAAFPIPDHAPQEVKDLAAHHWTPEVIQFAKDKIAGVKPK